VLYRRSARKVIHNYVLAEFVALAHARRLPRALALDFVWNIAVSPAFEVVWVDRRLHEEAMTLLRKQLDKTYSLCDAVSFLVMKEKGISDALTTDKHFEQAGFRRLLRERGGDRRLH
jgi:predicted nucleic acid-binding protein